MHFLARRKVKVGGYSSSIGARFGVGFKSKSLGQAVGEEIRGDLRRLEKTPCLLEKKKKK